MRATHYDRSYDPPAPVIPIMVGAPMSAQRVLVPALVDTGADCSIVATMVARGLRLPAVDRSPVRGVTGPTRIAWVYVAQVDVAGLSILARLVAIGSETIIGRDLLGYLVARLDGPRGLLALTKPGARR